MKQQDVPISAMQSNNVSLSEQYARPPEEDSESVTGAAKKPAKAKPEPRLLKKKPFPSHEQVEAYWVERKRYLEKMKRIPELRGKYLKAISIYMLRRFLWSFGFFPVFLSFWVPLVLARFNPVAMVADMLPALERFVNSNPEVQASTIETIFIAWFSIGFIFAVFDFVLTPFKSPYEYEADVHMRAWEELQNRNEPKH